MIGPIIAIVATGLIWLIAVHLWAKDRGKIEDMEE